MGSRRWRGTSDTSNSATHVSCPSLRLSYASTGHAIPSTMPYRACRQIADSSISAPMAASSIPPPHMLPSLSLSLSPLRAFPRRFSSLLARALALYEVRCPLPSLSDTRILLASSCWLAPSSLWSCSRPVRGDAESNQHRMTPHIRHHDTSQPSSQERGWCGC